jgi:small subunit ribosomal protein S17
MAENDTENQVEPEAEAETPEPQAASEPEAPVAPGDDAPAEEEPEAEPEPAEQPAASDPTEVPAAAAEPAEEPPAPAEPKRKRKRLPRLQRPTRARPRRERPKDRKPITRLPKPEHERGRRQERRGVVVSSAMDKTIVVEVDTIKAHPRYKKVVRRSTKFHAHDERNEAKVGDIVRIVETRPLSKTKHWRLAEVVEAAK